MPRGFHVKTTPFELAYRGIAGSMNGCQSKHATMDPSVPPDPNMYFEGLMIEGWVPGCGRLDDYDLRPTLRYADLAFRNSD